MTDNRFSVDVTQRAGAWFWFSERAGRLVLWNATPFPSEQAASDDALATHQRWMRDGDLFPYAGAI